MRPSLLHPRGAPRHPRRHRRTHRSTIDEAVREPTGIVIESTASADEATSGSAASPCDPAVQRVRDAGGPVDQATYVCECGYFFSAAVSTSVACPHCGADQTW